MKDFIFGTDNRITRRIALKRMGVAMAGALAYSSGLLSLTSCDKKDMKRVILYFTGTGNCLYVARQLGGRDAELLSIPQLMRRQKFDIEADEIGIVYPIYGHMPPNMVRRFLEKAKLKADYKYAVLTYGNRKCNAVEMSPEGDPVREGREQPASEQRREESGGPLPQRARLPDGHQTRQQPVLTDWISGIERTLRKCTVSNRLTSFSLNSAFVLR